MWVCMISCCTRRTVDSDEWIVMTERRIAAVVNCRNPFCFGWVQRRAALRYESSAILRLVAAAAETDAPDDQG